MNGSKSDSFFFRWKFPSKIQIISCINYKDSPDSDVLPESAMTHWSLSSILSMTSIVLFIWISFISLTNIATYKDAKTGKWLTTSIGLKISIFVSGLSAIRGAYSFSNLQKV